MGTTIKGERAPPSWLVMITMPRARARPAGGNQLAMEREKFGNAPASPAPKRKRMRSKSQKLEANPVSEVKTDHQMTMRVSTRREPYLSASEPVGISNTAYAKAKIPTTHPHAAGEKFKSCWMRGPATAMQ